MIVNIAVVADRIAASIPGASPVQPKPSGRPVDANGDQGMPPYSAVRTDNQGDEGGPKMGDISLIRTALLVALIAAFGLAAAGRAPAAESEGAVDTISFPQP
jgi:hypothetical protein